MFLKNAKPPHKGATLSQKLYVNGFRLFDKVKCAGKEYFIFARRVRGDFDIRDLSGNKKPSVTFRKLKLITPAKSYLTERRCVAFS